MLNVPAPGQRRVSPHTYCRPTDGFYYLKKKKKENNSNESDTLKKNLLLVVEKL